jgi:NAD(P)-dependent dehydrogenase (short-subunit alcohol dehydrogenase family)
MARDAAGLVGRRRQGLKGVFATIVSSSLSIAGLGLAAALRLAQEGARLSLIAVNTEALEKAREAIRAEAPHSDIALITADVSSEDEVGVLRRVDDQGFRPNRRSVQQRRY